MKVPGPLIVSLLLLTELSAQTAVPGYYPGDRILWERAFRGVPSVEQPRGRPIGGILPHHDIDLFRIGGYFRSLAAQVDPPVVVLLSPNHFEWGSKAFIWSRDVVFQTIYGDLGPDAALRDLVLQDGRVAEVSEVTDAAWSIEHGVFVHGPFLKQFFPRARFVPMLVKMGANQSDLDALVARLNATLPPGSLVLGSVDFSHYQIREVADYHDLASAASIRNLDDRILDKEIDSPESVYVVMRFCQARGASHGFQVARTSSGDFSRNSLSETTSHQYWTFVPGTNDLEPRVTLVAAGRSLPDLSLGVPTQWPWDRWETGSPGVRTLKWLAGKEARFLGGVDLYLVSALSGWTYRSVNNLRIGVYGWSESQEFDTQFKTWQKALAELDFVVVVRDGGPSGKAWTAAQVGRFADAGVHLVLDRTGDIVRPPAILGPVLWIQGLGDLVTQGTDSRGNLVLASWKDGWTWSSFPLSIQHGVPQSVHQFWTEVHS